jgi:hypothetical protein
MKTGINVSENHRRYYYGLLLVFMTILSFTDSLAQGLNGNWEKDLSKSLEQFMNCTRSSADKSTCSVTVGESIATVYQTKDFYSQSLNRYLTPNEISKSIVDGNRWKLIGYAYDQKALEQAQQYANSHKAVIAVYRTAASSHVVLILPGSLHFSGSWGFNVPNSASFSHADPDKSYVGKGLSYGFAKAMMKDITLYSIN